MSPQRKRETAPMNWPNFFISPMPASTANRPVLFALALAIAIGLSSPRTGSATDDFLDDARLKADFETRLTALFEKGGIPSGAETQRQLREAARNAAAPLVPLPPMASVGPAPTDRPPSAIYESARRATLLLGHLFLCGTCDAYHASLSGGVVIHPDGLALTNYHVLDNRQGIVFGAMTDDGTVHAIGEIVAASEKDDIALIRLGDAVNLPFASLQNTVTIGAELFVISHPDGFFHTLTKGYLSRKYLTPETRVPRLQITADFAKGSSGSGIFNAAGELVGLATTTHSIYSGTGEESPGHVQMIIKSGVPISSVRHWFAPAP